MIGFVLADVSKYNGNWMLVTVAMKGEWRWFATVSDAGFTYHLWVWRRLPQ